jgi:hypothetical protein
MRASAEIFYVLNGNASRQRLQVDGRRQIAQPLCMAVWIWHYARAKSPLLKFKRDGLANLKGRLLNTRTNRHADIMHARAASDKFAKCRGNNFTHNAAPTRMHRGHHARGNVRDKNGNAIGHANGQHVARVARKNGVALHKWRSGADYFWPAI